MNKVKDKVFKVWIGISLLISLIAICFIIIYIFKKGYKTINIDFIMGVPEGLPLGKEGGIYPAIIGSLWLMFLSVMFSSILAIGTAVYLVYYNNRGLINLFISIVIQCISGIPSVVLGLFGYTLFVLKLKFGRSLISASLTLAIMIFPFIEVRVEKVLREIDRNLINSSYALGIPKYYTILKLVLPSCRGSIMSAIILAGALSIGASAPIMLTGGVLFASTPRNLYSPVMALPLHLYILIGEGVSIDKAYGTALVLIIILLLINIISLIIGKVGKRR